MNLKNILIPEYGTEVTVIGRIGQVFYWLGCLISLILVIGFFWEPWNAVGAIVVFLIGRSLMYILSGR